MLTAKQLEEIRAREEKYNATYEVLECTHPRDVPTADSDISALLAEVERLRERNEKLERVKEAAKDCLDGAGMAHYPYNVHVDYCKYEFLRDALSALDEQEASDAQDR